jgi:hypothetical protein
MKGWYNVRKDTFYIPVLMVLMAGGFDAGAAGSDETVLSGGDVDLSRGSESVDVRRPKISHDAAGYSEMHPLDIPDDAGFYIYSHDGLRALRIYGSFRMLSVFDNKDNFHAYDLVPPKIPAGDDNFENLNSEMTIKMSRLGLDALIAEKSRGNPFSSAVLIRLETDWKGDTEQFRVRHFFLRSKNWLLGHTWSTFNNLAFLPQTVDGRMAGAGLGMRTPQVRYYTSYLDWNYQISLEHRATTISKPETVNAITEILLPDLAGRVDHSLGRWNFAAAGILRPNRIQYPDDGNRVENLLGYGGVLGVSYRVNDRNRLTCSFSGGTGMGTYMADFAWSDIDVAYNPSSMAAENVDVYAGFVALEHYWSEQFSSTIGGSYLGSEEKDFFQDLRYIDGYKCLANLFYKPNPFDGHLVCGCEALYAERTNMNEMQDDASRVSLLVYYNF